MMNDAVGTPAIIALVVYLLAMLGVGMAAYRLTKNLSDYILGGRSLGAAVTALSAGASDMSGWLMLGLPGAIYASGLNQVWIAVGLTFGALANWRFIARRLRRYTERAGDALTIPDYFENRFGDESRILRVASAAVILIFFTIYTSAGLVSGAILFQETFGLGYFAALLIGSVAIVSYTFIGGFIGVCWTDSIQGVMMFFALLIVPAVAISSLGGWDATLAAVSSVQSPTFLDAFHDTSVIGAVSLMAWGLGYFGQPHILARFMAIRDAEELPVAQAVGMTWMVLGLYGALATGFTGIAYFANAPLDNPESVFLEFAKVLFNPWITGFLLAAVLAAIMSTVSSQLLVSASVLAEDFYKRLYRRQAGPEELVRIGRLSVLLISIVAVILASDRESSVLSLVAYAWAGFGAAFGPVIVLSLFWKRMTRDGALGGMTVGAATVLIWKHLHGGLFDIYEILPGFIFAMTAIVAISLMERQPSSAITDTFDAVAGD